MSYVRRRMLPCAHKTAASEAHRIIPALHRRADKVLAYHKPLVLMIGGICSMDHCPGIATRARITRPAAGRYASADERHVDLQTTARTRKPSLEVAPITSATLRQISLSYDQLWAAALIGRNDSGHSIMMNVTWQRFDQSAKQLIVGHTTFSTSGSSYLDVELTTMSTTISLKSSADRHTEDRLGECCTWTISVVGINQSINQSICQHC